LSFKAENVHHRYIHAISLKKYCTKTKIYDVHLRLRLILQTRVTYAVFVARQGYQRSFCDGLEMKFTSTLGWIQQLVRRKKLRKALPFAILSVSDCKRLDTSLYFIITNTQSLKL